MGNGTKCLEFSEITECEEYQVVNNYLKIGWTLFSTHIMNKIGPPYTNQQTIYCLGWPKALGKVKHPRKKSFLDYSEKLDDDE